MSYEKERMIILGNGIASAMCAGYFASYSPDVYGANMDSPLNRHRAILRIKDPKIGLLLGCKLKQVEIEKAISFNGKLYSESDIRLSNMYSLKVNGGLDKRSINDMGICKRFLIDSEIKINNLKVDLINSKTIEDCCFGDIIISTLPMPVLLDILELDYGIDFEKSYNSIFVTRMKLDLNSEVYQTIYFPGPDKNCYRASIERDELIIESIDSEVTTNEISRIVFSFGIFDDSIVHAKNRKTYVQSIGKMIDIDDKLRRKIIYDLTSEYGIYSLGRFATWRSIRTDDLLNDLDQIAKMIEVSDYERRLKK